MIAPFNHGSPWARRRSIETGFDLRNSLRVKKLFFHNSNLIDWDSNEPE